MARTGARTPLPRLKVFALCVVQLNEAFVLNMVWSFAPYLVEDLGVAPEKLGLYVGAFASGFFLAQLVSSLLWGWVADNFGRRPAILLGMLGSSACVLMFGMSFAYWWALLARFLGGLSTGNIGVLKTYVAEITDNTNQAEGFSLISFAWGLGCVAGPIVGGFLSRPVRKYGDSFGELFATFPYLLPCLVSMGIGLFGAALVYVLLPETDPFKEVLEERRRKRGQGTGRTTVHAISPSDTPAAHDNSEETDNDDDGLQLELQNMGAKKTEAMEEGVVEIETVVANNEDVVLEEADGHLDEQDARAKLGLGESSLELVGRAVEAQGRPSRRYQRVWHTHSLRSAASSLWKKRGEWMNRSAAWGVGLYAVLGMEFLILDEMGPVLAKMPVGHHGFGFTTNDVGVMLMIGGVMLLGFQLLVFPRLARRFGYNNPFVVLSWVMVGAILGFPLLAFVAAQRELLWALIVCFQIVKMASGATLFTVVFIMIANSCTTATRGKVNGVGQAVSALARAIGPLVGGALWNLSLTIDHPASHCLLYILVACLQLLVLWSWWRLRATLPREAMRVREG